MQLSINPVQLIYGIIVTLSAIGVITSKKPVHSSLYFLLTLITLAAIYLELSAPFISVMQVLVYAGAILVIFMFVIILFQDAYLKIADIKPQSNTLWLFFSAVAFVATLSIVSCNIGTLPPKTLQLPESYGTVQSIGNALYVDFFFPFEAIAILFLVAIVGALYIGKKVN